MLATVACLAALVPIQSDATALYNKVLPSVMTLHVVRKGGGTVTGTAFLAFKDGIAVTAWHVVADAKEATVKFADGAEYDVSGLIDKDERRDVALIRVKVAGKPLLSLQGTNPAVGTKAYAVGAPQGLEFSLSEGIVSQLRTEKGIDAVQFTCPVSQGNSGGPLLDSEGRVLGVVSAQVRDGQNLNFASPAVYAMGLDQTLPTKPWDTVVQPAPDSNAKNWPRLSEDILGTQTWTRPDEKHTLAFLLYYVDDGEPVDENVYIGAFVTTGNDSYKAVGLSVSEAKKLRDYLRQAIEKDNLEGIEKSGDSQTFTLQGSRFISGGYIFEGSPFPVTLRLEQEFFRKIWGLTFKFEKIGIRLKRDEAKGLHSKLSQWLSILEEYYGIGAEPAKAEAPSKP